MVDQVKTSNIQHIQTFSDGKTLSQKAAFPKICVCSGHHLPSNGLLFVPLRQEPVVRWHAGGLFWEKTDSTSIGRIADFAHCSKVVKGPL